MMDFHTLRQEAAIRRSTVVGSAFGDIPGSIGYLEGLLSQASLDGKHLLFSLILSECVRADNKPAEVHYLRCQLSVLPLQPILLASLAYALASVPASVPEALLRCEEAVSLAQHENRQVRYCLTCQARLALNLGDYKMLSSALCGLIADARHKRAEDIAYQFDFVDQIDDQHIDPSLLRQYKALA